MTEEVGLLDHTKMRESLGYRRQVKPPVHEPPPLEYFAKFIIISVHLEAQRMHFPPAYGYEKEFRPCRRYIDEDTVITNLDREHGKLHCQPFPPIDINYGEKVHYQQHLATTDWNTYDLKATFQMGHKCPVIVEGTQQRRCLYPSKDTCIELLMGRKHRVLDMRDRNYIPCYVPGDKNYSNPEFSPGFFITDRYMPNSDFDRKNHTYNRLTFSTLTMSKRDPNKKMVTYKEKHTQKLKNEEVDGIKSLTNWEEEHGFTKNQQPEPEPETRPASRKSKVKPSAKKGGKK